MRDRARAGAIALALVVSAACRPEAPTKPRAVANDAGPQPATCARRVGEKLGIPFVQVCPADLPALAAPFEPFWIAAAPVGCSGGAHDAMPCPSVVAIVQADVDMPPRLAAGADLDTANRVCAMRFAGRLPTRTERVLAREALGASTLVVLREGASPTRDEIRELAEWVTERPWEQPSTIDATAGPGLFPHEGRAAIGSKENVLCRAERAVSRGISIGETCLGGDCVVTSAAAFPRSFALECESAREPPPPPPPRDRQLAAFRCVVPESVLDGVR